MTPHDRQFIEYTPFNTSNVSLDKIINTISSESLFLYVLCAVKAK